MTIQEAIDYAKDLVKTNKIPDLIEPADVAEWMDEAFRYIDKNYADLVSAGVLTESETIEKNELITTFNQWVNGEITVTL